jgi:hypothetical protein
MTRPFVGCLTVFVMGTGTAAITQKVLGPEEFDRAMKTIGTSVESVNRAIESNAYLDAKTPLALSRRVLASTRPFWEINERPDASRLTTEAVVTLDRLDRLLSANAVDASAVATAVQDVASACEACHATYLEGDRQTGYRIKPESR